MSGREARPGVSRNERISDEGLKRLEAQLSRGTVPSEVVLTQWLRRYGDAVRELLQRYNVPVPGDK